ncbi:ABC transporter ATP-binding protein, partial [bacterium]
KSDEENSRRIAYCLEALGAIKEIKSAQKEDFFCKEFSLPAQNLARAYARVNVLQLIPSYFVQAITAIFIIGLALFQMHSGSPLTNIVPILAFYVVGGYRLMPSLLRFSGAISQLRQNKAVFDNVVSILAGSAEEIKRKPAGEVQPVSVNRQIQLKDIVYTYPGARRPVLDHLELTINKDSFVAIVGGSGVGKTTLVDILLGLLPVDSGTIQIDDRPLTEGAFSEWRRIIGYIPQSVFLLNTTIGSNIAFGIPEEEINWAKVKEAANMSHLDEFINQLPEGLYTHVGERGIKLSGGQLQRIGIARALYTDPQVLILDESTSALDGITEQGIVETLKELKNEKIVIVIAHRHSTVRNAEVIVLLEKGKVSDLGPYDDLIARNAHFRKLMSQWQSPLSMPSLSAAGMTHHLA